MKLNLATLLLFFPVLGFGMFPQPGSEFMSEITCGTIERLPLDARINFSRTCTSFYNFMHQLDADGCKDYLFAAAIPLNAKLYTKAMHFYAKNKDIKSFNSLMKYEGLENRTSRRRVMESFVTGGTIDVYGKVHDHTSAHHLFNNIPYARLLLEQKAQLCDLGNATLFHFGIANAASLEFMKMLLEYRKSDINEQNQYSSTPLDFAILYNRLDIAELLLPLTDLTITNSEGMTVLHKAVLRDNDEVVTLLLHDPRMDENAQDRKDRTALDYANGAYNGNTYCNEYRKLRSA